MSETELKKRIIKILEGHTREMEGYSYFSSNPGIPEDEYEEIADEVIAALAPQWQPIETAPTDELVVVCWLDDEDTEHPERHEFDYIEDGMWVNHANLVEHAQAVAPPGSRIPKEQAPYQWWMPLPAPPEVEG